MNYIFIGIGGFFGALTRYVVGKRISEHWKGTFPMGTFIINLSGAFALGLLIAIFTKFLSSYGNLKLMMTTGFLGAYTTFSTYTYESIKLFEAGEYVQGVKYIVFSSILGILVAYLGLFSILSR